MKLRDYSKGFANSVRAFLLLVNYQLATLDSEGDRSPHVPGSFRLGCGQSHFFHPRSVQRLQYAHCTCYTDLSSPAKCTPNQSTWNLKPPFLSTASLVPVSHASHPHGSTHPQNPLLSTACLLASASNMASSALRLGPNLGTIFLVTDIFTAQNEFHTPGRWGRCVGPRLLD